MFDVKMGDDEKIISVFFPPKRAAYYSFIKNCPGKLIILLILFYYLACGFYSVMSEPVIESKYNTLLSERAIKIAKTQIEQLVADTQNNNGFRTSWRYSYEYHGDMSEAKPYFLGLWGIILLLYFRSQIRKQRSILAATSYTLTNKRIIVQASYPKQSVLSVNYSDLNNCTMMQTPLHWLLNIYFICLSETPVRNDMLNAMNQISSASNDIVDILSPEHAKMLLGLFNKDPHQSSNTYVPTSRPLESNQTRTMYSPGEKIVIKHNPRYMLTLIPHYFMLYGVGYAMAVIALFVGVLFESGFFNLFSSQDNVIKFISAYVIIFIVIAYLRSDYLIKNYEFVFTNNELTLPQRPALFIANKIIPYQDISNLNVSYSRFNLYQVNFTANVKQKVLGARDEYRTSQIQLSIPGLSKENAEKILFIVQ